MWAGLSYTLDYAEAKEAQDEVVNQDGVTVFIDKKAQLSILGTEMDFQESKYCPFLKLSLIFWLILKVFFLIGWLQNLSSTTRI